MSIVDREVGSERAACAGAMAGLACLLAVLFSVGCEGEDVGAAPEHASSETEEGRHASAEPDPDPSPEPVANEPAPAPAADAPAVDLLHAAATTVSPAAGAEDGSRTPAMPIDSSDDPAEVSIALAPPQPAPARAPDAAYFVVSGRGLVRLAASGAELLFEGSVTDFAVDGAGAVYVVSAEGAHREDGRHLFVIADGERRELSVPPDEHFNSVALQPTGAPVLAGAFGIWRRRGAGWYPADTMDDTADDFYAEQPQDLVIGSDGVAWARGQHRLFRGLGGRYRAERIPGFGDANVVDVAVGPSGVVATASNLSLCVRRASWRCFPRATRQVTVGPDGTVAAGVNDGFVVAPHDAEPVAVPLAGAGIVTDLARDTRGRTWVASTGGLFVVGPDRSILRHWPAGVVPGVGGRIDDLQVSGRGPELPAPP